MARRLENWSRSELRAVIRFLWAKNVSAAEIHRQIVEVYGAEAMSRQHVAKWRRSFETGREDVENRNRGASGRPSSTTTELNTVRVDEMIQNDRRVTVRAITAELGLSYGTVQRIVTDVLRYSKVCARWVPRALSEEQKATRMMCSLTFLQRYHADGQHFIDHIVTGDETWLHHFVPTTKRATMEWKHARSPTKKKFKVTPSAGKVMASIFWDSRGVLLIDYLERGHTVTAERYCGTLRRLREAIRRKRPGMLSEGVILLHDNARPHTARQTQDLLQTFKWEVWNHPPPYSPDLAPSDYCLFPKLKEHLSGTRFSSDSDVKTAAENWLNGQGRDFYQAGLNKLVLRSDKCLNRFGDYVEK